MSFQLNILDEAYERFNDATRKIETIKKGIQENRNGEKTLAELQIDPEALARRISAEHTSIPDALERINGVPNFQDIQILNKIFKIAEAVGRITIKTRYGNTGFGTGFLIAPGILITNNHVFPDKDTAESSTVQFYYEMDGNKASKRTLSFNFEPEKFFITSSYKGNPENSVDGLDFTIIAISEKSHEGKDISEVPHTSLNENLGKIIDGENCVIIQHPKGDYKKIVMKDIRMLTLKDDFLIYESDTLPGSSGAVVIGQGTGEIVALHHSSVPRKNTQGQILRKDGGVYSSGDPDESIDWMGNEGVRISSIIKCIRKIKIPKSMETHRNSVLKSSFTKQVTESETIEEVKTQNNEDPMKNSDNNIINQSVNILQDQSSDSDSAVQYFEVELVNIQTMQDDWIDNYQKLIHEIVSNEPVFPFSTSPSQKSIYYVGVKSNENPWEISAKLEALPQIKNATPDLPMETDMQFPSSSNIHVTESDILETMKTSAAVEREDDFKTKWNSSHYFDIKTDTKEERQRGWNRIAVGLTDSKTSKRNYLTDQEMDVESILEKIIKTEKGNFEEVKKRLKNLKLIQLDTGYTDHSKVKGRFNYENDEDFIDGSDARDEMVKGILKHPGHGTRTASIICGGKTNYKNDGNYGILTDKNKEQMVDVIPYRIAESVVLIGRGKNLVDAVNQAVNTGADVLFMCMGSYPRLMISEAAKSAYENGIIWCCAAGNEVETIVAPALYPGTIAVAAINPNQKPWKGSSYGKAVDIAAPGEDVYVPSMDKDKNEIMAFGSGTSYATPHVAAAAALWKAKNFDEIYTKYKFPWQIVEAFRMCLKNSVFKPENWDTDNYGAGILDISNLLSQKLPEPNTLQHAYTNFKQTEWDLGIREGVHYLWKTLIRKVTPGKQFESDLNEMIMTERGRIAVSAITGNTVSSVFESDSVNSTQDSEKILKMYFDSYKN
ncbi:S8 family serine peptidase [Chryseobacterium sp.]|uniref:S8 family serine peptidase n=1 Tax=Chryseobacterium sp. TaxID=1871047 RepID=UPI0028970A58|nr:S8 family serine peptidase [Chryseobacterium sp.]